jgi:hypothetical protein
MHKHLQIYSIFRILEIYFRVKWEKQYVKQFKLRMLHDIFSVFLIYYTSISFRMSPFHFMHHSSSLHTTIPFLASPFKFQPIRCYS